jgi:hypothetical protein
MGQIAERSGWQRTENRRQRREKQKTDDREKFGNGNYLSAPRLSTIGLQPKTLDETSIKRTAEPQNIE